MWIIEVESTAWKDGVITDRDYKVGYLIGKMFTTYKRYKSSKEAERLCHYLNGGNSPKLRSGR